MKGHKWFAALYDRILASEEKKFLGAIRAEMLRGVTGNVLEIGAGTGVNFQYYQPGAHVTAIEPDPYMLQRARIRASEAHVDIDLRQLPAEELPFADASFDFVIDTLVLCSVRDPRKVLLEIRRVLKPGGELRLYEHVRYKNPLAALSQDLISPAWQWFGAGCHPNRNTEQYLREAGFELNDVRIRKELPPIPPMVFTRPHLQAVARRPISPQ
jgi:ubiquinone/menaquinone biosynthesis C-methylase UbiE